MGKIQREIVGKERRDDTSCDEDLIEEQIIYNGIKLYFVGKEKKPFKKSTRQKICVIILTIYCVKCIIHKKS